MTTFYEKLVERAEAIARDINGDREAEGQEPYDTGFECYTFNKLGLIYMGDLGSWAFALVDGKLEEAPASLDYAMSLSPYSDWGVPS